MFTRDGSLASLFPLSALRLLGLDNHFLYLLDMASFCILCLSDKSRYLLLICLGLYSEGEGVDDFFCAGIRSLVVCRPKPGFALTGFSGRVILPGPGVSEDRSRGIREELIVRPTPGLEASISGGGMGEG